MNAASIGALAVDALLLEIDTWPKPGLVSPIDNGSHSDMSAAILRRSATTLEPFFVELAQAGASHSQMTVLRRIGLAAEAAMFAVTGGVNTHRGAIFGMGLLCAAAGLASTEASQARGLGAIVQQTWGASIKVDPPGDRTHGARMLHCYGSGGAREEAAGGFTHIYQVGWPALRHGRLLADGTECAARVHCCFALIAAIIDTNLLYRGGLAGLNFARGRAAWFIRRGGVGASDWHDQAVALHRSFVARHLSPGGSADLLAMTVFVDAWQDRAGVTHSLHAVEPELV
jgi:triphosphoribosyl-dephospho-CoA synthase